MLYRLQKLLSLKSRSVKTGVALPLLLGGLAFTPMSAFALDVTVTEYNVRFDRASVQTADGIASAYQKLEKKAKRACYFGRNVNDEGDLISKEDCASDLLEQFVQSASLEALSEYHIAKTESKE